MMERIKIDGFSFRKLLAASPKTVLLLLALLNLFAIPARYAQFCFHNWSREFLDAFLVLVAVACLWLGRRFGYVIAILACCSALYNFSYTLLYFLGLLPLPENVDASAVTFETWWGVMQHHPEEFMHAGLATVVLIVAAYYLLRRLKQKERVFK